MPAPAWTAREIEQNKKLMAWRKRRAEKIMAHHDALPSWLRVTSRLVGGSVGISS